MHAIYPYCIAFHQKHTFKYFRQVKIRNKWPDSKKNANKRFIADLCYRQVKIRNKWPDSKKIANKRFIADLC